MTVSRELRIRRGPVGMRPRVSLGLSVARHHSGTEQVNVIIILTPDPESSIVMIWEKALLKDWSNWRQPWPSHAFGRLQITLTIDKRSWRRTSNGRLRAKEYACDKNVVLPRPGSQSFPLRRLLVVTKSAGCNGPA
jgi:hypothetical protein